MKLSIRSLGKALWVSTMICIGLLYSSCNPGIRSFTVDPLTITSEDSVQVNWDVSGTASLFVHERPIALDSGVPDPHQLGSKMLEFTLLVRKGKGQISRRQQVMVLADTSSTEVVFPTKLEGDTLVAAGIKNPLRWGTYFEISTIRVPSNRNLFVRHTGKDAIISDADAESGIFKGTPIEGPWEFRSVLTAEDRKDMSSAPEELSIIATIHYKRR